MNEIPDASIRAAATATAAMLSNPSARIQAQLAAATRDAYAAEEIGDLNTK